MKHHYRVNCYKIRVQTNKIILLFCYKSLKGWTFAFSSYYNENITRLLDNPYFQTMTSMIDPYGLIPILEDCLLVIVIILAYFDRYRNIKICQFQGADDEFFLPDSEVSCLLILL